MQTESSDSVGKNRIDHMHLYDSAVVRFDCKNKVIAATQTVIKKYSFEGFKAQVKFANCPFES